MSLNSEYLVVGGGVVGLSVARELKLRYPDSVVVVLEKEDGVSKHASGRNSGVIHAGFYYSPDSLKAKLTLQGNESMKDFCTEKGLPIVRCGKVVVARKEEDKKAIQGLFERGLENGVDVELIDERRLYDLEPLAQTLDIALWSPNTAVADPLSVSRAIAMELEGLGVEVITSEEVKKIHDGRLETKAGNIYRFRHLVNCAGLYADRIAHAMGFGGKYSMIPFLGLYFYAPALTGTLQRHIYPAPDPRNPFLGVHFTRTTKDELKVGPTAIPVLSREQYGIFEGFKTSEFAEILKLYPKFAFSKHHDVWSLVKSELPKISRTHLLKKASLLTDRIDVSKFIKRGTPGIRAQLFDIQRGRLEMDFVIEGDAQSTHVLNAVSPGWTTCFSFAKHVVDDMESRVKF